jgi:monofunctional biosynthetic peptidoglycan transglycosylase
MRWWSRKRTGGGRALRRWLRRVAVVIAVAGLLSWLPVLALRWLPPPTTAFMLLDPTPLAAIRHEWVNWSQISASVPLAVMAAEDQKFPSHFGFDLESIRDALAERRDGDSLRGASTISQQVAKNLFLWPGRSFFRNGLEAYFTLLIEVTWPKQRILEVYVNVAELGTGIYGIGAASRAFFGKSPAAVDDAEAALLAAVLPNPRRLDANRPSDYVRERQRWILGQMRRMHREQLLTALD